jgi:hypothetical protein
MMMGLVLYAVVVELVNLRPRALVRVDNLDAVRLVIFAIGVLMLPAARVVRGALLRRSPADGLEVCLARLTRASLFAAALSEAPAVLGLALFFIDGRRQDFYLMILMSIAMFALNFPRLSAWREWLGPEHRIPQG